MDLYNPHSLLDEAVEDSSLESDETSNHKHGSVVSLSTLMQSTPVSPDHVDLEKIVVTGVLFIVAFFLLAPRSKKRRRVDSKEKIHLSENQNNNTTLCTGMVLHLLQDDQEETEEELFLQTWPEIRTSPYRRLVLSPECKRVSRTILQQSKKEKKPKQSHEVVLDEDHPIQRLRGYRDNVVNLIKNILSFEYIQAVMTVIQWLTTCIRLRRRQQVSQQQQDDDDEEEDDDDDASSHATESIPNSPLHEEEEEEKKEMHGETPPSYGSQSSGTSVYEVPLNDAENHHEQPPPPSIPRLQRRPSKRKDALESYRSSHGAASLQPKVPSSNHESATLSSDHKRNESLSFFDAAHSENVLKKMTAAVPLPDRNGYILGDEFLPNSRHTPLLVFVNSRSGPQQGQLLITQLRRLLNPIQVWDLAVDGGPEKVLESFSVFSRYRILVCGGDGTVSWIICALEKLQLERWPPIAILPLGTGNDLARIHGWGGGYTNESLIAILQQVADSYISLLDRWEMTVERKGKVKEAKSFTNYLGVGVDAQAALQVHMLRESMPKFFFSRFVNKAWYALFGAEDAIKATHANLPHEVTLIADGVKVPLPQDSQGIILLNIDSYAGGIPMWSHANKPGDDFSLYPREALRRSHSADSFALSDARKTLSIDRVDSMDDLAALLSDEEKQARLVACDMPSSCQDGMLDIVAIKGAFHLGQIRVGLSHAQRLCQCREATIIIKRKTAIHIDGEPWRQTVATLHVKRKKEPAIMLHRSNDESGGVETEMAKLLDWAEERQIIDRNVHATLMKEFSRRIESKTRQRRVRSQENLMLTLSRALQQNSFPSTQSGGHGNFPNSISF